MLTDLTEKHTFGPVISYLYTIEYKKLGLLHFHLFGFLDQSARLTSAHSIVVSTEFPDDVYQLDLLKRHMVHGLCGSFPSAACITSNGLCTRGVRKPSKMKQLSRAIRMC